MRKIGGPVRQVGSHFLNETGAILDLKSPVEESFPADGGERLLRNISSAKGPGPVCRIDTNFVGKRQQLFK
jgi:hypothetical protein